MGSAPLLYNLKLDKNDRPMQEALFSFLIPTNLDNSKVARYVRQTSIYLHFILTVPFLLFICFMDPNNDLVNEDFDNTYGNGYGYVSLNWAELELSKNPIYKYLVVGLLLGCGISAVFLDLLFTICW